MDQAAKIEIPVDAATAAALTNARRLEAVGRLVDRLVRPGAGDPLAVILGQTACEAQSAGFNAAEVEAELSAYNLERRI